MCGRYALHAHPDVVALQFGLAVAPQLRPRYNIAPTQEAPVIRIDAQQNRALVLLRWGLVPSWSKDPAIGSRMINARAETAAEKPAFRNAFRHRRCLVPADGYYEWKLEAGRKQPYLLQLASGGPFGMAGLWESWRSLEGEVIESYAILTTDAAGAARQVHDRMPVIVAQREYGSWLSGTEPGALLRPSPGAQFTLRRVSTRLNSPRNDDPGCQDEGSAAGAGV